MIQPRNYALFVASLLCLLYSCTPTAQAARPAAKPAAVIKAVNPPIKPEIIGPDEAPAGQQCVFEAAVPEKVESYIWFIDPPSTGFIIDTGQRRVCFSDRRESTYTIWLSIAGPDGLHSLMSHKIRLGEGGPDPIPPDPIPPNPGQKYDIMLFTGSGKLDDYAKEMPPWTIMLGSTVFRDKLKERGHTFRRGISLNTISDKGVQCVDGKCTQLESDLLPWFTAAKQFGETPSMAITPSEGGKTIVVSKIPQTLAEFWKLIGEKL